MEIRENELKKESLKFNAKKIILAVKMIEKLEKTIELVYHLMENEGVEAFVLIFITAKNIDMDTLLEYKKRDTDILFEIDKEEQMYVMLCQDTKVDGGYHFAGRIIGHIIEQGGTDVYCSEVEVRSTRHKIKNVILKLLEIFIKMKHEQKINEIEYKSLN